MATPPPLAAAALLGATTRLVRRVEIYESDGTTRWKNGDNDDRLVDGSVTVDYGRDERRILDSLVLDNSDNALIHSPSGFWYDKVLKVYYGVQYVDTTPLTTHDIRVNLSPNPKAGVNTSQFSFNAGGGAVTGSRITSAGAPEGIDTAYRATWTANASSSSAGPYNVMPNGGDEIIGPVSLMALGRSSKATRLRMMVNFYTDGVQLSSASYGGRQVSANVWNEFKVENITAPAGTNRILVGIYSESGTGYSAWVSGDTVDMTGVQMENRDTVKRFDGDTFNFANRKYGWYGTPENSTSYEDITVLTPRTVDTFWETQIGEFMIDSISEQHFPYTVKISGRDYTKKCLLSKYVSATSYGSGQKIETVIKVIAQNAGILKFSLPSTGKTLAKEYYFERGTDRWSAMKQIAEAYGYELFFNAVGVLIMREYKDPVTSPVSYTLATGPVVGNLVSYEKSLNDSRIFNYIVVTGESNENSIPAFATAVNTNPSSPTRVAKLGNRVYQYTSSFITTDDQALDVATKFLKVMGLEEYDLNFSSINFFWLEVGDIVKFVDPNPAPGAPDKFLLSSLTIPLGLGPMSGNAKRVSVVG